MDGSASRPGPSCASCGKPLSRYNPENRCQACVSSSRKDELEQSGGTLIPGENLAELRRARGLTQEMLAGRAGVSASIVEKLEGNARRSARMSTLRALASVLNVPLGTLLGFESPERQHANQRMDVRGESQVEIPPGPYEPTLLRVLLTERHWQLFSTFEAKFTRAAAELADQEGEPRLRNLTVSRRQFERWYAGTVRSHSYPDACRVLEHMFGYTVQQLLALASEADGRQECETGSALEKDSSELVFSPVGEEDDDEEVIRRRAFLLNAALLAGIGKADPVTTLEALRRGLRESFPGVRDADVSEWNEIALEYGETYPITAPADLLNSLIVDFTGLQEAFRRYPHEAVQRELYRVSALLAGFVAQTVGNLGYVNEARRWWRTARYAADRSGDSYSALWVRGREIIHAMGERPIMAILHLIEEAEKLADNGPPELALELLAAKAQTMALAARHADAESALTHLRNCFDAATFSSYSGSLLTWGEDHLHCTESFVYSRLGEYKRAERARHAALVLYDNDPSIVRWPAGLELNRALCLVRKGDVAEGVSHARTVIAQLPTMHQTRGIYIHGRDVLNSVLPPERERPVVSEYREWLDATFRAPAGQVSSTVDVPYFPGSVLMP